MDGPVIDEAVCRRAREAMSAARRAEHTVLDAVRELDAAGVAQAGGYRSTEALVQDLWRVDLGEARRLLRHARAVCGGAGAAGEDVGAALPATAKSSADGILDRGHVRVIDEAIRYLERVEGIDPAALTEAEEFLVEHAAQLAPRGLARVAARLIAALDPDGVAPDEDPEPTDELRLGRRRDGSLVLKGRFRGRADIELVLEAFDALSGRAGAEDRRDLAQRYAETLLDLCAHATSPGGLATDADPADRVEPGDTTGPVDPGQADPRHRPRDPEADDAPGRRRRRCRGRRHAPRDPPAAGSRPAADDDHHAAVLAAAADRARGARRRHHHPPRRGTPPGLRRRDRPPGPRHALGTPRRRAPVLHRPRTCAAP